MGNSKENARKIAEQKSGGKFERLWDYAEKIGFDRLAEDIERNAPLSEEEFIKRLYKDIDKIIREVEKNADMRQNDPEDRTTIDIQNMLLMKDYNVSHDSQHRGRTDLIIKTNEYTWIGEAKKFGGNLKYAWLKKGIEQIHKRYNSGRIPSVGMLIYIYEENASDVMRKWKEYVETHTLYGFKETKEIHKNGNFVSIHEHQSGTKITITHFAIYLHYPSTTNQQL